MAAPVSEVPMIGNLSLRWRLLHLAVAAICLVATVTAAQETTTIETPQPDPPSTPAAGGPPPSPPRLPSFVTRGTVTIDGAAVPYIATVGTLAVADEAGVIKARFVYTMYAKEGGSGDRPLTFAFNGGPGASSAYLHLGALGPQRADIDFSGPTAAPVRMVPNPHSWLAFTDLVMFDPIGTGLSRPAQIDGKPVPNSDFWGVEQDVNWTARFIRQVLTRHQRWSSPKFLAGESYGGLRAARLADALPSRYGIQLTGIVFVSPAIEFGLAFGDDRLEIWPAVLRLPTYAAVALHHGKVPNVGSGPAARDQFLAGVEKFGLAEMLPALAQGSALPAERREALYARVASFTGIPVDLVRRAEGRVTLEIFIKEVLRGDGRVIGRYDGTVAIADANPASPYFNDADPTSQGIAAPLLTAMNAYLQNDLKVVDERPYILMNVATNSQWDHRVPGRGGRSLGGTASLRAGMIANPMLKVLVVHGRHDLVTPYFTTAYPLGQMQLEPATRRNISVRLYDGGHMMYLYKAEREALYRDVSGFYADTLGRKAN
jgi:carboxypeptidase C (cathepsin A)